MRLQVVIPTRNRAAIAEVAVQCILDQDAPGVSVLVSDNSTDPGEGAMQQALADPEVTHVAFLPDRRVFRRGGLALAAGVARRHPGRVVTYMYDEVRDHQEPIQLWQNDW